MNSYDYLFLFIQKAKMNGASRFDGSGFHSELLFSKYSVLPLSLCYSEDWFFVTARPSSAPASMKPSVGQHPKSYIEVMCFIDFGACSVSLLHQLRQRLCFVTLFTS